MYWKVGVAVHTLIFFSPQSFKQLQISQDKAKLNIPTQSFLKVDH